MLPATIVPWPGAALISSSPFTAPMRSRMPINPAPSPRSAMSIPAPSSATAKCPRARSRRRDGIEAAELIKAARSSTGIALISAIHPDELPRRTVSGVADAVIWKSELAPHRLDENLAPSRP
jgi:hypothetical protein